MGLDLGRDTFQIHPSYRSGTVLDVGTDATVLADGVLVGDDGKPLALLAGKITPLGTPGAAALDFFTNRTGRFRIEGLKPGAYELRVPADSANTAHVEIPASTVGVYRLGDVMIGRTRP
jgi:outer membrane usher protein